MSVMSEILRHNGIDRYVVAIVGSAVLVFGAAPISGAFAAPSESMQLATPMSKQSAERQAKNYLEMSGFSRQGLIKQLEYEGHSTTDATAAVDALNVNWNAQAARKAKEYLAMSGFSRQGMIQQLEYEGFTASQAAYGATAVGL